METATQARTTATRLATVVATDPRPMVRAGLRAVLGVAPDVALQAVCPPAEALATIEEHLPAVLLVSVASSDDDPFALVAAATALHPSVAVLVLVDAASLVDLREAVAAGADSFLLSDSTPESLAAAVKTTARGERALSPEVAMTLASAWHDDPHEPGTRQLTSRELEVLTHMADGRTNQEVAEVLGLSPRTVKTHVQHLLAKLHAPDRTGAVATAFRLGLIR